jgi:hypothetical protein
MPKVISLFSGKKVYIGCFVGMAVLLLHKAGVPMPGVTIDDQAILNNLWILFMVAFGRAAMPDKKGPIV